MKRRALVGWGVGSFTSASLIGAVGLLHLRFLTDSLGLAIGVAGSLVVVSRLYDAVLDPIVGMISDRSRTPWGRYRPYLLVGGWLSALSLVLLFNVPLVLTGGGLVAYAIASLLFFSTAYTLFRIPYLAMGRSMTQNFAERSRLMSFSVIGSSLGGLAATSAAPLLLAKLGSNRAGHGLVAIVLAGLIASGALASFLLIGNQEGEYDSSVTASHSLSARRAWAALRDNRPFQRLMAFKLSMFAGLALHIASLPFYTRYVLRTSDASLSSIFFMQTMMMMASQLIWGRLARRLGRRNALMVAALGEAATMVCWCFVPAHSPSPWMQILGGCEGVFGGGIFFGLYTVLTDTMDYARQRTDGAGQEGVLAGIFVMAEKATSACGAFVLSGILGSLGYISAHNAGAGAQPPGVIAGIYVSISVLPATAAAMASLFIRGYRLPVLTAEQRPAPPKSAIVTTLAIAAMAMVAIGLHQPACAAEAKVQGSPVGTALGVPTHLMVKRVYAGADGTSHMDEVELPRVSGGDGRSISSRLYVTDVELGSSLPGRFIDWHGVSTPRLLVVLSGEIEIGVGDGAKAVLKAGDIAYVTDTTGRGHTSRMVGTEPVRAMTVRLDQHDPLRPKLNPCPEGMAANACVSNSLAITMPSH
jgi:Na+/melibiose symporter-like transporter